VLCSRWRDGNPYLWGHIYTGCFKKSFTTLKASRNLYRGHIQRFELSKCSKPHRVLPRIVIRNCFDLFFFHSYGDSLKIKCSYHLCLQMSLNSELKLLPQLQKWRQRCYVACGKRLTTGGGSAALPMEVTFL
jgi:hypothetical protein